MSTTIRTATKDGQPTGAITVETLSDGCIGLGIVRYGAPAFAAKLPRDIARRLAEALAKELLGMEGQR